MSAAVGVLTRDRYDYFARCVTSLYRHLNLMFEDDSIIVYDDGSTDPRYDQLLKGMRDIGVVAHQGITPRGVAHGKNWLLREMLDGTQADFLFLCEDDLIVLAPEAVTGYIEACTLSGLGHLSWHGHGGLNPAPIGANGPVTYWPASVGAWTIYSREALADAGLMDEAFSQWSAMDHVEHSQRLADAGWTTPWPYNADATGSEEWLAEQPGAIESSIIRADPNWPANIEAAKAYWQRAHPATYTRVFGPAVTEGVA